MIKVCEHCSNVDIEELRQEVGEENVEVGCLGECAKYESESYGIINDELVVEINSKLWIKRAKS